MSRFALPTLPVTASGLRAFHFWATLVWLALAIPSLFWWKQSVPWVVFMSVWANVAGHFSSWQAARIETQAEQNGQAQ